MNFKKWVKSIQTAGYNGARTVVESLTNTEPRPFYRGINMLNIFLLDLDFQMLTDKVHTSGGIILFVLIFKSTDL